MGLADDRRWGARRAWRPIAGITMQLPCDFLVLNDRDLDTAEILVPTAGGPDSALAADVARSLARTAGSAVRLLHIVDDATERAAGEQFLAEWADAHGLEAATRTVDESGDIETAIERAATDSTLIIIGATEKGLLSRLVAESLHLDVASTVDCSVLLAERPHHRTLRARLFGRGQRAVGGANRVEPTETDPIDAE